MQFQYNELDNDIRLIKLTGKLDIIGTGEIETKLAGHCAGDDVHVIVDLSDGKSQTKIVSGVVPTRLFCSFLPDQRKQRG